MKTLILASLLLASCAGQRVIVRQQIEIVCDSYERKGTTIVCHGEGLPDLNIGEGNMGWADDPDHPGTTYQFVTGYVDTETQIDYRGENRKAQ